MSLPAAFLDRPLAHRGLHNGTDRVENSRSAFVAAVMAGYGIELDVQLSADGQAIVFHDDTLDRLTTQRGPLRKRTAGELGKIRLADSSDRIETLTEILNEIAGRVPVVIELKDQSGALAKGADDLEHAVAKAIAHYNGPVAVMSFNQYVVENLATLCPHIPRGLTTGDIGVFSHLPQSARAHLDEIPLVEVLDVAFASHAMQKLGAPRVAELKSAGLPVLCWTVRSPDQDAKARQIADNITFEGYLPRP